MPPRKVIRTLPDRAARWNPSTSPSLTIETPWPDDGSDIDPEYEPSDIEASSSSDSELDLESESEVGNDEPDEEIE